MLTLTCIIPSLCTKVALPNLRKCVSSLQASANGKNISIKVIIVTNSRNIKPLKLKIKFDSFIYAKKRFSFAEMNNVAIEQALYKYESDWIVLINDDAYVQEDFFDKFLESIVTKRPGIVVPLIIEGEGPTIDSFGVEYYKSGYAKNSQVLGLKTQLAAAACLVVNSELLYKMMAEYGFCFNNILYSYMDDVEFSIRARGLGTKIIKNKKMVAHHLISFSSKRKSEYVIYQTYRNLIWLVLLTWPTKSVVKHLPSILLVQCWAILYCTFRYNLFMYIKIVGDTLHNLPTLIKLRSVILSKYTDGFNFESILSEYTFRTHHGLDIKI